MAKSAQVDEYNDVDDPEANTSISVGEDGRRKFNFKNVKSGFEPFPAGTYPAKVTGSKDKVAKSSGNPMIEIKFTIQDDGSGDENNAVGRNVWRNYTLTEKSLYFFKQFLLATGQFTEEELDDDEFEYNPEDIMGADVMIEVEPRVYTGSDGQPKTSMDVKSVTADDGSSSWGN